MTEDKELIVSTSLNSTLFIKINGLLAMKFISFCKERRKDHDRAIEEACENLMDLYHLREAEAKDKNDEL